MFINIEGFPKKNNDHVKKFDYLQNDLSKWVECARYQCYQSDYDK